VVLSCALGVRGAYLMYMREGGGFYMAPYLQIRIRKCQTDLGLFPIGPPRAKVSQ
jgi:hypothetical protein